MADVFISYASDDQDRVEPLARALEEAGLSVWWDQRLRASDRYADEIETALGAARRVIVVWSSHSIGSHWVRDEAKVASASGKLVPVRIDPVDAPLGFGQFHNIDFCDWSGDASAHPFRSLQTFERQVDDVFAIQSEIARAVLSQSWNSS